MLTNCYSHNSFVVCCLHLPATQHTRPGDRDTLLPRLCYPNVCIRSVSPPQHIEGLTHPSYSQIVCLFLLLSCFPLQLYSNTAPHLRCLELLPVLLCLHQHTAPPRNVSSTTAEPSSGTQLRVPRAPFSTLSAITTQEATNIRFVVHIAPANTTKSHRNDHSQVGNPPTTRRDPTTTTN
jgi:hypothetical protein